jgi:hypothetical protein
MALLTQPVRRSGEAFVRPLAQAFVREVHATLLQVLAYAGLFALLGLAVMEFLNEPHLERAAMKLLSSPAMATRSSWIASPQEPELRGRQ